MALCTFLLAFYSQIASSSDIVSIFPPHYSHYFNAHTDSTGRESIAVELTEAVLGEEKHTTFGISLWVKMMDPWMSGNIFWLAYGEESFLQLPCLSYRFINSPDGIDSFILYLQLYKLYADEDKKLSLLINLPENWIFIAISASYEKNLLLFYYNNLGAETYNSRDFGVELTLLNAVLWFEKQSMACRIGDFKIYNNIFNEISDWSLIYSNSCLEVSCASSFPSVDYGKCDQWCESQPEPFFRIIEHFLYSKTPYLAIYKNSYLANSIPINVTENEWNDFSITGWLQISECQNQSEIFFTASNVDQILKLTIKLRSSSPLAHCDVLEATIYSFNGYNKTDDSVQLYSSNYIGNWFFFAVTINSASKLFTLYSQNMNISSAFPPLISSSTTYTYSARSSLSLYNYIFIGGGSNEETYPGNYADFRFYPDHAIDSTLMHNNNSIFSPATYLDPHCTLWESIWYCKACDSGYFVRNGICQKCHPSCAECISNDTEADCLSCASGYYAQPGHPSLCFDYCPTGYIWNSTLNQCIGTKGAIANIDFDDNLSGDFISSSIYVKFGLISDEYYPKFEFLDPLPANKRGIFMKIKWAQIISQIPAQKDRLFSSDFTIEIWAMVSQTGSLFHAAYYSEHQYFGHNLDYERNEYLDFGSNFYNNNLSLCILKRDGEHKVVSSPLSLISENSSEWALFSVSLMYDDFSKSTKILFVKNKNSYTAIVSSHYKETYGLSHYIGSKNGASAIGFFYSLAMYNYGKTYSEVLPSLGTCSSCSACPGVLNYCLPTCDETEYVDENGNCQKCPTSCSWICSRAGTCNLCYDDLCYKCTKYEIGTCTQCIENAVLKSGQCECQSGFIKQGLQCVTKCDDGFYLDSGSQSCLSCPENCLKCLEQDCIICKAGFAPQNGKCKCEEGYFANFSNSCLKCDISCLTCSISSSNCTSCTSKAPILYNKNKCYPCDSFEGYSRNHGIPISYFEDGLFEKLSKNCIEICGDGRNMGQAECDDGNNNNEDGCSSNCLIEPGWHCSGGNTNSSDTCKDEIPPLPILKYLNQNDLGYRLSLSFSEAVTFIAEIREIIEIEIDGITNFDWSISLDDSIYIIALEMYENIDSKTNVTIIFTDPSAIVDMRGNEMKERLFKISLAHSFVYESGRLMENSIANIVISATVITIASSVLSGKANFQALWSMIEMMQMQYYLIFLSPKYPGNLLNYINALSISFGSFLPNPFQRFLARNVLYLNLPKSYPKDLFIGQFLLVWLIAIVGLPTSLLILKLYPRLSIVRWLKKSYLYSIFLRIGILSFLETTLFVFLKWKEVFEQDQNINYISLLLTITGTIYLILTFILIIWQVTLKSEEKLTEKLHKRRFGTLYEAFKSNSKLAVSFILLLNTRKILFVTFCVFLYNYLVAQVAISALLILLYILSLVILKPFKAKISGNHLHITSEAFYFLAMCLILRFIDADLSNNGRAKLGQIIVTLLCLSLLLHIIALFIIQVISIAKFLKQLKKKIGEISSNELDQQDESNLNATAFNDQTSIAINKNNKLEETNQSSCYVNEKRNYIETDEESFHLMSNDTISANKSISLDSKSDNLP